MPATLLNPQDSQIRRFRFGSFEVDLQQRALYNRGIRVGLQHKPFRILELLLRKRGALVTREELAQYLWPNLHVSFDRGLNTAVNVLRRALGDSPANCRFIETRSGLGYRFIAPVEEIGPFRETESGPAPHPPRAIGEAQHDYLKGRFFSGKMTGEDLRKSVAHFEAALKQDPAYALAYTGLARVHCLLAVLGMLSPAVARQRVIGFSTAALRIDPSLAEAQAAAATLKMLFDWDWAGAERACLAALDLNSGCAEGHQSYAALLCATGKTRQALSEIRLAQELDPLSTAISAEIAWTLYIARDYEAAVEQSWKTLVLDPRFAPAQHALGLACEQLGMYEEAITEFQNAGTCSSSHPSALAALAHAYAVCGDRGEALCRLRELEEMSRRRHVSPYWLAIAYSGLAEHERALDSIEKAVNDRDIWPVWIKVEPRFDPLRSHARFTRALRSVGFDA